MIAQIKMRRGTTAEWAAASPVVLATGEPGWDSTLKGMKVGDGSTEWAVLPWIDAKIGQNLLHNADFRNPVNQRGVSGNFSAINGYFIDRWYLADNSVTLGSDSEGGFVQFVPNAYIGQAIEGTLLAGKVVTVSLLSTNGVIHSGTGTFPTVYGNANFTIPGFGTLVLAKDTGKMAIGLLAPGYINIYAVKLELGTVSTLHLDPPMDRAVELVKCKLYFERLETIVLTGTATNYAFGFTFAEKRITPTVTAVSMSSIESGASVTPSGYNSVRTKLVGSVIASVVANSAYHLIVDISSDL